jgi:hypothetical protein
VGEDDDDEMDLSHGYFSDLDFDVDANNDFIHF